MQKNEKKRRKWKHEFPKKKELVNYVKKRESTGGDAPEKTEGSMNYRENLKGKGGIWNQGCKCKKSGGKIFGVKDLGPQGLEKWTRSKGGSREGVGSEGLG